MKVCPHAIAALWAGLMAVAPLACAPQLGDDDVLDDDDLAADDDVSDDDDLADDDDFGDDDDQGDDDTGDDDDLGDDDDFADDDDLGNDDDLANDDDFGDDDDLADDDDSAGDDDDSAAPGGCCTVAGVPGCAGPTLHSGVLGANETWLAADGPHLLTADLTVPAGVTLEVEPGTTVLADPGAALLVHGTLLAAGGSAACPLQLQSSSPTPAPGDWDGIELADGASAVLTDLAVRHAVKGLRLVGSADGVLVGATVEASSDAGVELVGTPPPAGDDPADFAANTVTGGLSVPVRADSGRLSRIDPSNAFTGNADDRVELAGSLNFVTDVTLAALDVPWDLSAVGAVREVIAGVTVTVLPGAVLHFGGAGPRGLDVADGGTLDLLGTAAAPVLLTSAQPAPAPGDWEGLAFASTALGTLQHAVVEHAGWDPLGTGPALRLAGSGVSVTDCTVDAAAGPGVEIVGVPASGGDDPSAFAGNLVTGGATVPLQLATERATVVDASNTLAGNADDRAVFVGSLNFTADVTLQALDVPWDLSATGAVREVIAGVTLTVEPGAALVFGVGGADRGLDVVSGGELVAQGTSAAPITWTSGQPVPAPGDWEGLTLRFGSDAALAYCSIVYAEDGVDFHGGGAQSLTDATVSDSSGCGVVVQNGASPTLSGNAFASNAGGDVCTP